MPVVFLVLLGILWSLPANAACTGSSPNWTSTIDRASVATCVSNAIDGDTITVGAGDDSTTWTSTVVVNKSITIKGQGIGVSTIRLGGAFIGPALRLYKASSTLTNARITGFTFSCSSHATSDTGVLQVGTNAGTTACMNQYVVGDWRIDHSRFINCGDMDPVNGLTGNSAITTYGYNYGLIDHNIFDDCNGECLDIGADGTGNNASNPVSLQRSLAYGGYTNGTVYIEDNTINYNTLGSYGYENFIDSNSGARAVLRFNTINICPNCNGAAIFSNHETCASRSCDGQTQGDVGSLVYEIYNNTIHGPTGSGGWNLFDQRGGRGLVYNNTWTGKAPGHVVRYSNLRSYHRPLCDTNARGYSEIAHEAQAGFISEGLTVNKTTLNGTISTLQCPTMASVSGFATDFGAVIIGTEQIDYAGISGTTLTPCTRGANGTTAASHANGATVNLLTFGVALEQINTSYVWGNTSNSPIMVLTGNSPDYSTYDIRSKAQRPANFQYVADGTAYSYTPYPYPHPLQGGAADTTPPAAPTGLRIM